MIAKRVPVHKKSNCPLSFSMRKRTIRQSLEYSVSSGDRFLYAGAVWVMNIDVLLRVNAAGPTVSRRSPGADEAESRHYQWQGREEVAWRSLSALGKGSLGEGRSVGRSSRRRRRSRRFSSLHRRRPSMCSDFRGAGCTGTLPHRFKRGRYQEATQGTRTRPARVRVRVREWEYASGSSPRPQGPLVTQQQPRIKI